MVHYLGQVHDLRQEWEIWLGANSFLRCSATKSYLLQIVTLVSRHTLAH